MSRRDTLRAVAEANAQAFSEGCYVAPDGTRVALRAALQHSAANTKIVRSDAAERLLAGSTGATRVTLSGETTLDALIRLNTTAETPVAVLNFASATTPGGGYMRGGAAQEESLCRAATLHSCLMTQPGFCSGNSARKDAIYDDALILSPGVLVIRNSWHQFLAQPFACTVLSCPAPNRTALQDKSADRQTLARSDAALERRIGLILNTVADVSPAAAILGAWGCGVFGNDPGRVARGFDAALRARPHLGHVHFAIPDLERSPAGAAFSAVFSGWAG